MNQMSGEHNPLQHFLDQTSREECWTPYATEKEKKE
jgi:hypothetical protein